MKSILREQRRSSITAAAIAILVGVLLVFWPNRSVNLLCMILGAAIGLSGVVYIVGWISRRKLGAPVFMVMPGVILLALGLWLVTQPGSVIRLIQYIFGAILIFHGVVDTQSAVSLMRQGFNRWWLDLMLSMVTVFLGILILVNPFFSFNALTMLIGLSLIYDGGSDLYLIWRISQAMKDYDANGDW